MGSKSPLALVNTYSLKSVKNGICYNYVYLYEQGKVPTPVLTDTYETKEDSGITVTVPLGLSTKLSQSNLASVTSSAINSELATFGDTVRIVDDATKAYDDMVDLTSNHITPPLFVGKHFSFYEDKNNYKSSDEYFIQIGLVRYSLNNSNRNNKLREVYEDFMQLVSYKPSKDVVFHVPIGVMDLHMSREYATDIEENINILIDVIKKATQEARQIINSSGVIIDGSVKEYLESINNADEGLVHFRPNYTLSRTQYQKANKKLMLEVDQYATLHPNVYIGPSNSPSWSQISVSGYESILNLVFEDRVFDLDTNKIVRSMYSSHRKDYQRVTSSYTMRSTQTFVFYDSARITCMYSKQNLLDIYTSSYPGVLLIDTADPLPLTKELLKLVSSVYKKDINIVTLETDKEYEDLMEEIKELRTPTVTQTTSYFLKHRYQRFLTYTGIVRYSDAYRYEKTLKSGTTRTYLPFGVSYLNKDRPNVILLKENEHCTISDYCSVTSLFHSSSSAVKYEELNTLQVVFVPEKEYDHVQKQIEESSEFTLITKDKPLLLSFSLNMDDSTFSEFTKFLISNVLKRYTYLIEFDEESQVKILEFLLENLPKEYYMFKDYYDQNKSTIDLASKFNRHFWYSTNLQLKEELLTALYDSYNDSLYNFFKQNGYHLSVLSRKFVVTDVSVSRPDTLLTRFLKECNLV